MSTDVARNSGGMSIGDQKPYPTELKILRTMWTIIINIQADQFIDSGKV
jgi:hypothetical protein